MLCITVFLDVIDVAGSRQCTAMDEQVLMVDGKPTKIRLIYSNFFAFCVPNTWTNKRCNVQWAK